MVTEVIFPKIDGFEDCYPKLHTFVIYEDTSNSMTKFYLPHSFLENAEINKQMISDQDVVLHKEVLHINIDIIWNQLKKTCNEEEKSCLDDALKIIKQRLSHGYSTYKENLNALEGK